MDCFDRGSMKSRCLQWTLMATLCFALRQKSNCRSFVSPTDSTWTRALFNKTIMFVTLFVMRSFLSFFEVLLRIRYLARKGCTAKHTLCSTHIAPGSRFFFSNGLTKTKCCCCERQTPVDDKGRKGSLSQGHSCVKEQYEVHRTEEGKELESQQQKTEQSVNKLTT